MEIILTIIMTGMMTYQTTASEFRHNSKFTFNIDPTDGTVVVMNTQTGEMHRCSRDFVCDLTPRKDSR